MVGVIAALAGFVARQAAVSDGNPDWLVIALAIVSFVAVAHLRVEVVAVVFACAALGLAAATLT